MHALRPVPRLARALPRPTPCRSAQSATAERPSLPDQAEVVVVGAGVLGASTAYHLAELGCRDVLVIEQAVATAGTTWHAAGLLGQLRATRQETELSVYGHQLYADLEKSTGQATGYKQCGSLTVAQTADRMTELRRRAGRARGFGIEAEMVSPAECAELWPYMEVADLQGGLWLPGDGTATSSDLCAALMKGAKMKGVKLHERTRVTGVVTSDGAVTGVQTDRGLIKCDKLINCAGQWARNLGAMAGVSVPLHSAEHFYCVTKPLEPRVPQGLPVMRDLDSFLYYREWSGGLLMGGFEPDCKPCFTDGVPDTFEFGLLEEDWEHFMVLMEPALVRTPALETAEVQMVNGPESFTPDNQYILGEAPELRNFFVAAGMNSSGIASAGGAGRLVAEWAHEGKPSTDVWDVDIRRFHPFQRNPRYLADRTRETLGLHYGD